MEFKYCKLEIFLPPTHLEVVQKALQEVDAGHIGNYDSCMSVSPVTGYWRPLDGCNPYIGTNGEISCEPELKVEVTVYTENADKTWTSVPKGQIHIPDNYDWKQYVKLQRLEMACGEAPYLVSRYDVTTGEIIPVQDRIGLLDRKFKLINQFTKSEPTKLNKREWRRWALRALQSVYGFDWQGDNVLLAREALLLTYIDFYVDKWGKFPLKEALEKPVEVISWNIWQMDGLQGTLPGVEGIPMLPVMLLSMVLSSAVYMVVAIVGTKSVSVALR